jgi:hypothetical protein
MLGKLTGDLLGKLTGDMSVSWASSALLQMLCAGAAHIPTVDR